MDTVTYPDPRVVALIEQHFVPLRIVIKENRPLAEAYFVNWTPNVVIADGRGRVHSRVEGFLPPEDFMAHLALAAGKYWLESGEFPRAAERFEEVAQRHAKTEAGAEALYWLGVARYKNSHDPAQLKPSWQQLAREHPQSEWATRSKIPAKS